MAWPWQHQPTFVAVGTPVAHWQLGPASSAGTYGALAYYGRGYGTWSMRVRINGPATSGAVQLVGTVTASSSEANSALVALTTWDGTVNSSDFTLSISGKPLTAVAPYVSVATSSGTTIDVWVAASA